MAAPPPCETARGSRAVIVQLTVIAPSRARGRFALRLPFTAGRGPEAKLRIQHEQVSRRHCEFTHEDGVVILRDLGSTNGTRVDGAMIDPAVPTQLSPGAVVTLGHVQVRVDYDPRAGAPTAMLAAAAAARLGVSEDTGEKSAGVTTDRELERFLRRLAAT